MYAGFSPFPAAFAIAPSTLSSGATDCPASGCSASIFLPSSGHDRPLYDISAVFIGGPTACEARLALLICTASLTNWPFCKRLRSTPCRFRRTAFGRRKRGWRVRPRNYGR